MLARAAATLPAECRAPALGRAQARRPQSPLVQIAQASLAGDRAHRVPADAARRLLARRAHPARAARHAVARRPVLPHPERHDRAACCCATCATPRCAACACGCSSTTSTRPAVIRCSSGSRRFRTSRCGCSIRSAAAATASLAKYASSLADFGRLNHRMHNKLFIADGAMVVAGGRNIADEYFMRSMTRQLRRHGRVHRRRRRAAARGDLRHLLEQPAGLSGAKRSSTPSVEPRSAAASDFNQLVDEGEQMMALALPPIDMLGYGPISEDLDAGRLGLIWGKATAFADSPAKVTATSDEDGALDERVDERDGPRHGVEERGRDLVAVLHSRSDGRAGVRRPRASARSRSRSSPTRSPPTTSRWSTPATRATASTCCKIGRRSLRAESDAHPEDTSGSGCPATSLGRLHAKTAVIDRRIVFIGSMNLDPRSASKNTELGIIVESPQLAKEVLRVIHISKLQSAYRLRFAPDGESLAMADDGRRRRSGAPRGARGDALRCGCRTCCSRRSCRSRSSEDQLDQSPPPSEAALEDRAEAPS